MTGDCALIWRKLNQEINLKLKLSKIHEELVEEERQFPDVKKGRWRASVDAETRDQAKAVSEKLSGMG